MNTAQDSRSFVVSGPVQNSSSNKPRSASSDNIKGKTGSDQMIRGSEVSAEGQQNKLLSLCSSLCHSCSTDVDSDVFCSFARPIIQNLEY